MEARAAQSKLVGAWFTQIGRPTALAVAIHFKHFAVNH